MSEDDPEQRADRARERRRDSRRPPRALRVGVAVGLGLALVSTVALGGFVLLEGTAPGGPDVPDATFAFAVEDGTEAHTVRVTQTDGTTFDEATGAGVYVVVGGEARVTPSLPFGPGDSVTVGNVSDGQTVSVVWVDDDGDEWAVGEYVVGASDEPA